jgi:hypothetical protein
MTKDPLDVAHVPLKLTSQAQDLSLRTNYPTRSKDLGSSLI